jgi:hypothetical protein
LRSLRTRTCCGFRKTALRSLTFASYAFPFTANVWRPSAISALLW